MKKVKRETALTKAKKIIRKQGGIIRTSEAIQLGIHPRIFYQLRDESFLEQLSGGLYKLADDIHVSEPDLVTIAARFPNAVICLISALSFHEITTQIPHDVYIALCKGARTPKIDFPSISVHHFSENSYNAGVEEHYIDGVPVKIYNTEKTLTDCFKFRNKIGMDVVLEALKFYKERKKFKVQEIMKYAKICRVEKIIRPYLEMTL